MKKIMDLGGYVLAHMIFWPYTLWLDEKHCDPFPYIGMVVDMAAVALFCAGAPMWLVLVVFLARVIAPTVVALWVVYLLTVWRPELPHKRHV